MPFFKIGRLMARKKILISGIVAAVSALLVVFVVLPRQPDQTELAPTPEADAGVALGITYLRVTPTLADYYHLGVDSGVLVTEVTPGSPMDLASIQAGDVILSYNGTEVAEDVSLLGLMRTCRPKDTISLEICRGRDHCFVEFCCCYGTAGCDCGKPVDSNEENPASRY
jgi:membrane-associated protease RseP (regulator of RpoE activity)